MNVLEPPVPEYLGALPAHVVVRDFPETLAVFRSRGIDLRRDGAAAVADLGGGGDEELVQALLRAVDWRTGL